MEMFKLLLMWLARHLGRYDIISMAKPRYHVSQTVTSED